MESSSELFGSEELRCLEAVVARIFPTTDTPGAIEAGAVDYVLLALKGSYSEFIPVYHTGLMALDRHCSKAYAKVFAALEPFQQDLVLQDLEGGKVDGSSGQDFFEAVRRHTLEGVLGDPQYGGNRDLIGWRIVGFPGQRHGYADPFINRVIDMDPAVEPGGPPEED